MLRYSAGLSRRVSAGATSSSLLLWSALLGLVLMRGTPESRAEGQSDLSFDFAGVVLSWSRWSPCRLSSRRATIRLDQSAGPVPDRRSPWSRAAVLPDRGADLRRLRRLLAVPQCDLYRCHRFQLPAQRRRRHADRVAATRSAGRQHDSAASWHADARLRGRDHRFHPGGREAPAALRRAQADGLGLSHHGPVRSCFFRRRTCCSRTTKSSRSSATRCSALVWHSTPRLRPTPRCRACRSPGGPGSGIYKMASSLGAAFGVAISAAIFTALSANPAAVDGWKALSPFRAVRTIWRSAKPR